MMEKRQPLSVMIALQSKKMKGGDDSASAGRDDANDDGGDDTEGHGDGKYDDPGLISASEDALDAMKTRDAKALSAALCHFMDIHSSLDDEPDEDDRN